MANAIFPCPFCGRRMGVNRDLLGRHVRCPHCKQVIQAPATEGGQASAPSAKSAPKPPPPALAPVQESPAPAPAPVPQTPPQPVREFPTFAKPPRESHESILGDPEESEDEVFTSRSQSNKVPDFSAFVPRLPGSAPSTPKPAPSFPDTTNFLPPLQSSSIPSPIASSFATSEIPASWGPVASLPTQPDLGTEAKSSSVLDVTNLAPHLPRPQFQAPPPDAKGTSGPTWANPLQMQVRPVIPPPGMNPGAPMPPGFEAPPGAPMPPGFEAPKPPPVAATNPWSAYDLSATQNPSLPAQLPAPVAPQPVLPSPQYYDSTTPPPQPGPTASFHTPTNPAAPPGATATYSPETYTPPPPQSGIFRDDAEPTKTFPAPARAPSNTRKGGSGILIAFLLLYALVATSAAVYAFMFQTPALETKQGTDLSSIPDVIGEYPPADRKKVGNLTVPLDGPLPESLKVRLNQPLQIGQLEVTPLAVEQKLIQGKQRLGKSEKFSPFKLGTSPSLVLRLKLKNISDDLVFHPTDPAFNRRMNRDPKSKDPLPATGLVFGNKRFWGGPTKWPFASSSSSSDVTGEYLDGQEDDNKPLGPGESRETVIVADKSDPGMMKTLASYTGPILWRVQLRRGLENVAGKDVSMTTIVGVEFEPKDIKIKS